MTRSAGGRTGGVGRAPRSDRRPRRVLPDAPTWRAPSSSARAGPYTSTSATSRETSRSRASCVTLPDGYADVGTPMGYGGPVGSGAEPPATAFFDSYDAWCAENRVVATFARFHPVLGNQSLAEGHWNVERIGSSVGWRVEGRSREELVEAMDSHHRRNLRKASADGRVEVSVEPASDLSEFVSLYEETMRRLEASAFYLFPGAYWEHLAGAFGHRTGSRRCAARGRARRQHRVPLAPPLLHYHLGASAERGQAAGANHLLFCETAAWAADHGIRALPSRRRRRWLRGLALRVQAALRPRRCTAGSSRQGGARRGRVPRAVRERGHRLRRLLPRLPPPELSSPGGGYRRAVILKALFWGSLGALAWTHAGYPLAAAGPRPPSTAADPKGGRDSRTCPSSSLRTTRRT